jgi:hypothetical protein
VVVLALVKEGLDWGRKPSRLTWHQSPISISSRSDPLYSLILFLIAGVTELLSLPGSLSTQWETSNELTLAIELTQHDAACVRSILIDGRERTGFVRVEVRTSL